MFVKFLALFRRAEVSEKRAVTQEILQKGNPKNIAPPLQVTSRETSMPTVKSSTHPLTSYFLLAHWRQIHEKNEKNMESFWSFRPRSRQAHNSAYESHLFLETLLETLPRLQLHRQWRQAFIWVFLNNIIFKTNLSSVASKVRIPLSKLEKLFFHSSRSSFEGSELLSNREAALSI